MASETKRCRDCGEEKSLADFFRHARSADGHRHVCKTCLDVSVRETKWCNVCRIEKPVSDFYRSNTSPDGRQYTCIPCAKERSRKWNADNPDRQRESVRRYMHSERYKETRKAYQEREREAIRANRSDWYYRNREAILERRNRTERGTPEARERTNSRSRKWLANNRRRRFYYQLKYAYGLSPQDWDAMLIAQGGRCAICDDPAALFVDHDHSKTTGVRGLLCDRCNHGLGHFRDNPEYLIAAAEYLRTH